MRVINSQLTKMLIANETSNRFVDCEAIITNIGEIGVADDDQQIIIRLIAILGFIDSVAARIAAEQNDFLYFAVLLPRLRRARGRDGKFVHQSPRRSRQFFLLRLRMVINFVLHKRILAIFTPGGKTSLRSISIDWPKSDKKTMPSRLSRSCWKVGASRARSA